MCLQCAMWLCTPESTETQTQKKHTNRYMIHACGNTEKHTCSDKAGSLAVQWIVVTMALVTDDAATIHKDSESGADLWLLCYNNKTIPSGSDTATSKQWHQDLSLHIPPCHLKSWLVIPMRPGIFHTFYYLRGRWGGQLPQAFCSFAHLLGQEHAWFGHKKVVHKYATYTNLQK